MNVADTELILGTLGRHGYDRVEAPDAADVILLNTCAIREHAEARVLGRLGDLGRYKAKRPGVRLGVTGLHGAAPPRQAPRRRAARRSPRRPRRLSASPRPARRRPRRSARRAPSRSGRDVRRPSGRARARRARVGDDHARLRSLLHVLHRAVRARSRAEPARSGARGRGPPAGRRRRARGRLPRADRERVPRRRLGLRAAPARDVARVRAPAHPLHVAAPGGDDGRRDRRHGLVRPRDAADAPARAVGLRRRARAHGARLHGRRLRAPGRNAPHARARHRPLDGRHRRLSRQRPATTSRRPRRSWMRIRLRRRLPLQVLAARRHALLQVDGRRARCREDASASSA